MPNSIDTKYQYPDSHDKIVQAFIGQTKLADGLWEESETKAIIKICSDIASKKINNLLDVGCGTGRLIKLYSQLLKPNLYIGIDPDSIRIHQANQQVSDSAVCLYNADILDFNYPQEFDVVICSHVIQHVRAGTVEQIINKVCSILKVKGYFILSFPYNKKFEDNKYYFSYAPEGISLKEEVTKLEYDESFKQNNNKLPVIVFSRRFITYLVHNLQLEIIKSIEYHIPQKHPNTDTSNYDLILLCQKQG